MRVHRTYIFFPWGLRCGCTLNIITLLAEELSCCDCVRLKSVEELCYAPNRIRTHVSHITVALKAQYLNVQRKLGTIIIQTVHIDSADKGSLPIEDNFKHNPNYFQITALR